MRQITQHHYILAQVILNLVPRWNKITCARMFFIGLLVRSLVRCLWVRNQRTNKPTNELINR